MSRPPLDLPSGLWSGYYEQSAARFPQKMTLEFADGLVRGDGVDGLGTFALDGEYRVDGAAVRLGWIKTYEGAHSVLYLGLLDAGAIVGHYEIMGLRGGFRLQPAGARG